MLRTLAQRLSRDVVVRRSLPAGFGGHRIYVSPDSALRYWRPGLAKADPELMGVARKYISPGMTVWDIGANVGLFSFCAAGKGARVVSLEPDVFLVSILRRSARATGLDVTPIPLAISDRISLAEFHVAERGRGTNHIGTGMGESGGSRWTETVPTATLDWLAEHAPKPDFIKIDVEAMENAVLRGGERLLRECHPMILCEVSEDPASRRETTRLLRDAGYRLLNVKNNQPVESAVFSTLAFFDNP